MSTSSTSLPVTAPAGTTPLKRLASPRLTLCGFVVLGAVTMVTQLDGRASGVWLMLPLAALWLNLLAAMATHRPLRHGGLGVFHAALAVALPLVAAGRLLHFEGRVEVAQGGALDGLSIEVTSSGPWHGDAWRALQFEQGPLAVDYAPSLKRSRTVSEVVLPAGRRERFGDSVPLVIDGYRIYTTHNKGFAPLIAFAAAGEPWQRGALHMPSYPWLDWKQQQTWRSPQGTLLRFWLRPDVPPDGGATWRFEPSRATATLVVEVAGRRAELRVGETIDGPFGRLRYEQLSGWMGYRISHDATLVPLFWCALAGVAGLAWHMAPGRRRRHEETA